MRHDFYLCDLKAGFKPVGTNPAVWANQENILRNVSKYISVSDSAKAKGVSSIPDVWARPLFFKTVLFDSSNELHDEIYEEWKGLISLIILSQEGRYSIELKKFHIETASKTLARALTKLKPDPLNIGIDDILYDWLDFAVIKLKIDDQIFPIGATSPATLVYTALDILKVQMEARRSGLSEESEEWKEKVTSFVQKRAALFEQAGIELKNGRLIEPTDPKVRAKIKSWIEWFSGDSGVLGEVLQHNEVTDSLFKLFSRWRGELGHIPADSTTTIRHDEPLSPNLTGHSSEIYRYISSPIISDSSQPLPGDFYLSKATTDGNQYILISEYAFKMGGDVVYGSLKKESVKNLFHTSDISGTTLNNVPLAPNVIWIKPELYFFTDKLISYDSKLLFDDIEVYNKSGRFILPLTQAFLKCFTNEEIIALEPKFKEEKNGDVVFSILLSIGEGKSLRKISISRRYRMNGSDKQDNSGLIVKIDIVPVVEMWPNFYSEVWTRYFLYYNDAATSTFDPFIRGAKINTEISIINGKNTVCEINNFPEALICRNNGEEVGAILINKTKRKKSTTAPAWLVGVDFGTSNTNVYVQKRSDSELEPLKFTVHNLRITNSNEADRAQDLYKYFLDMTKLEVPFVSALRIYQHGVLKSPLRDYSIHFIDGSVRPDDHIVTNVKWHREYRIPFIDHLTLIIIAEAVNGGAKGVSLCASYPLALNNREIGRFRGLWTLACQKTGSKINFGVNTSYYKNNASVPDNEKDKDKDKEFTESVAAGKYFEKELKARKNLNAICIDVGGGTSDICIWSEGQIKYQSSVTMAGNLISDSFRKSEELRRAFFYDIQEKASNDEVIKNQHVDNLNRNIINHNIYVRDEHFESVLNYHLRKNSVLVKQKMAHIAEDSKSFEILQAILLIEFGAIAYYGGMVIDAMCQDEINRLPETITDVDICWGGGGSQFIKWIDLCDDAGKLGSNIFTKIIKSFKIENTNSLMTKAPKAEAAYGLIVDAKLQLDNIRAGNNIVGEDIVLLDGTNVSYKDEISPSHIIKFNIAEARFGPKFYSFIKLLDEIVSTEGFKKISKLYTLESVEGNFRNTIASKKSELKNLGDNDSMESPKPIFIIEVEELIRSLIDKLP